MSFAPLSSAAVPTVRPLETYERTTSRSRSSQESSSQKNDSAQRAPPVPKSRRSSTPPQSQQLSPNQQQQKPSDEEDPWWLTEITPVLRQELSTTPGITTSSSKDQDPQQQGLPKNLQPSIQNRIRRDFTEKIHSTVAHLVLLGDEKKGGFDYSTLLLYSKGDQTPSWSKSSFGETKNDDSGTSQSQQQKPVTAVDVGEFQKGVEICLLMFVHVFYEDAKDEAMRGDDNNQWNNDLGMENDDYEGANDDYDDDDDDDDLESPLPYIPLEIAQMLWEHLMIQYLKNQQPDDDDKDVNMNDIKKKASSLSRTISNALLSPRMNMFKLRKIPMLPETGRSQGRYDFLYASSKTANPQSSKNTAATQLSSITGDGSIRDDDSITVDENDGDDGEDIEIRFNDLFFKRYGWILYDEDMRKDAMTSLSLNIDNKETPSITSLFCDNFLLPLLQRHPAPPSDLTLSEPTNNNPPSFPYIYILRYLPTLLHSSQQSHQILIDPTFLSRRISIFGILEASLIHMDDLTLLSPPPHTSTRILKLISSTVTHILSTHYEFLTRRLQSLQRLTKSKPRAAILNDEQRETLSALEIHWECGRVFHALGVRLSGFAEETNMECHFFESAVGAFRRTTVFLAGLPQQHHQQQTGGMDDVVVGKQQGSGAVENRVKTHLADSLSCLAYCHDAKMGEYALALSEYEEALGLYKRVLGRDSRIVSDTLHNIGTIQMVRGRYGDALACYRDCLTQKKLAEERQQQQERNKNEHDEVDVVVSNGEDEEMAHTLQCMGSAHMKRGEFDLSLRCLREAMRILVNVWGGEDYLIVGDVYRDMSECYFRRGVKGGKMGIYWKDKALECCSESLRIRRLYLERELEQNMMEENNKIEFFESGVASDLYNKGRLHFWRREWDKGLQTLEEAMDLRRVQLDKNQNNSSNEFIKILLLMAKIEFKQRNEDEALSHLDEILDIHQRRKASHVAYGSYKDKCQWEIIVADSLRCMGRIYFQRGNYDEGMKAFRSSLTAYHEIAGMKEMDEDDDGYYTVYIASLEQQQQAQQQLQQQQQQQQLQQAGGVSGIKAPDDESQRIKIEVLFKVASVLVDMGCALQDEEDDFDKAIQYLKDSLKLKEFLNNGVYGTEEAEAFYRLGYIYKEKDDDKEALVYFQKAIDTDDVDDRLSTTAKSSSTMATLLGGGVWEDYHMEKCDDNYNDLLMKSCQDYLHLIQKISPETDLPLDYNVSTNSSNDETTTPTTTISTSVSTTSRFFSIPTNPQKPILPPNIRYSHHDILFKLAKLFFQTNQPILALSHFTASNTLAHRHLPPTHPQIASINHAAGLLHASLFNNIDALKCFNTSLEIFSSLLNQKDKKSIADVSLAYHHLGATHSALERYDDAVECLTKALDMRTAEYGTNHLDVAETLHVYGTMLMTRGGEGKEEEALEKLELALSVRRALLEVDHPSVADTLVYIGTIKKNQGMLEEAKAIFGEVLSIRQHTSSDDGDERMTKRNIAAAYFFLGQVCARLKEYETSFEHFRNAEKFCEGGDDGDKATPLHERGCALRDAGGRGDEAMECLEKALVLRRKAGLVDSDPGIVFSVMAIGSVHFEEGRLAEALQYYQKALAICKGRMKQLHLAAAESLDYIGRIWDESEEWEEALKCYQEAWHIYLAALGDSHEKVGDIQRRMAKIFQKVKDYEAALDHYHDAARVLEMQRDSLYSNSDSNADHNNNNLPDNKTLIAQMKECYENILSLTRLILKTDDDDEIADVMNRKGNLHAQLKQYDEAMSCFKVACRIHLRLFGENHLSVANDLHNLGALRYESGDYDKSIECFMKSLSIVKKRLGEDSYEEAETLHCMGNAYRKQRSYDDALGSLEEALRIRKKRSKDDRTTNAQEKGVVMTIIAKNLQAIADVHLALQNDTAALSAYREALTMLKDVFRPSAPQQQQQQQQQQRTESLDHANILHGIGNVHANKEEWDRAVSCYDQSLKIKREHYDKSRRHRYNHFGDSVFNDKISTPHHDDNHDDVQRQHPSVALTLNGKGAAHRAKGELSEALACFTEALKINNFSLGPNHHETIRTLKNVGTVYSSSPEQVPKAMKYFNRAREGYKMESKEEDVDVADVLYFLGCCHDTREENDDALECYTDALRIYRVNDALRSRGKEASQALHNMGVVYYKRGELQSACDSFREAISVKKQRWSGSNNAISNDGWEISLTHECLGKVLCDLGEYDQALDEYQLAQSIHTNVSGKDSLAVATTLFGKGIVYMMNGGHDDESKNYEEAHKCFAECLRIRSSYSQDESHFDEIAEAHFYLGKMMRDMDSLDQGWRHLVQALEFKVLRYGGERNHVEVAEVLFSLGVLNCERGEYETSIENYTEALSIYETQLGSDHMEVGAALENIGIAHHEMELYDDAVDYFTRAWKLKATHMGEKSEDVALIRHYLGKAEYERGRYDEALAHLDESLRLKSVLLIDDSEIVQTILFMGHIHRALGDPDKSLQCYDNVLRLRNNDARDAEWGFGETLYWKGKIHLERNELGVSLHTFSEATAVIERNIELTSRQAGGGIAMSGNVLSMMLANDEREDRLMECYENILKLTMITQGNTCPALADVYTKMGNLQAKRRRDDDALNSYKKAAKIQKMNFGDNHLSIGNTMHNMGNILSYGGNYDDAIKCFKKSLSISQPLLGDFDEVADTITMIGHMHKNRSEYEDALKCYLEVLRIRIQLFGKNDLRVANILHSMSVLYNLMGEHDKALAHAKNALLVKKSLLGIENLSFASTLFSIGNIHKSKMEYERAIHCLEEVLRVRVLTKGELSLDVAETLDCIGSIHDVRGHFETSTDCYVRALSIFESVIGYSDPHPMKKIKRGAGVVSRRDEILEGGLTGKAESKTLKDDEDRITGESIEALKDALNNHIEKQKGKNLVVTADNLRRLGYLYDKFGRFKHSMVCNEEALSLYRQKLNKDHLSIAEILFNVGVGYTRDQNFEKAFAAIEESLRIRKLRLKPYHEDIEKTYNRLGNIHVEVGNDNKALHYLEEAVSVKRSRLGKSSKTSNMTQRGGAGDHDDETLFNLGILHHERGEHMKSIRCFEECLKIRTFKYGEESVGCAEAFHRLGTVYREIGNLEAALSHYKTALRVKVLKLGPDDADVSNTLFFMGIVHCELGRFDDALNCYDECLRVRMEQLGKDNVLVAQTLTNVGIVLYETNEFEKASESFKDALDIFKKILGDTHEEVAYTYHCMGNMYRENEKYDEAMECFQHALHIEQIRSGETSINAAHTLQNIGIIFEVQGDDEKAMASFTSALKIRREKLGNEEADVGETLYYLAKLYLKKDERETALEYFTEALHVKELCYGQEQGGGVEKEKGDEKLLDCFRQTLRLMRWKFGDDDPKIAETIYRRGTFHAKKKDFNHAIECYFEAIKIFKFKFGDDHLAVANALHNLGNVLNEKNDIDKAIRCYKKALNISKNILGQEHEEVADTMHSLGNCLKRKGVLNESVKNLEQALQVKKSLYNEDHLSLALTLNDLGLVHGMCNRHDQAMKCYREALRIRRQKLGGDDVSVSNVLHNMGTIHKNISQDAKAVACFEESLRIRKLNLGSDDMRTADTLLNLGAVHDTLGDDEKALLCYQEALRIYKLRMGDDNIALSQVILNIAGFYESRNEYEKAIASLQKALEIRISHHGDNHQDVADVLNGLGNNYYKMRKDKEAMESYEKALKMYQATVGKYHASTASTLHFMGVAHAANREYDEALDRFAEALRVRLEVGGENNEDYADTLYCIGNVFNARNEYDKAFSCFDKAQKVHRKKRGASHLSTSNSLYYMANIHEYNGDIDLAMNCYIESLLGRRKSLGENHIDTAACLYRIGVLHHEREEEDRAVQCLEECLRVRKFNFGEDHQDVGHCALALGAVYETIGDFNKALEHYDITLKAYKASLGEDSLKVAKATSNIAGLYVEINDDVTAIEYYENSLRIYRGNLVGEDELQARKNAEEEEEGEDTKTANDATRSETMQLSDDYHDFAEVHYNLGAINDRIGEYRTALSHYRYAMKMYKSLHDGHDNLNTAKALYSVAIICGKQAKLDKAMLCFQECLRIRANLLPDDHEDVASTLFGMGVVYEKKRMYVDSLRCFQETLRIRKNGPGGKNTMDVASTLDSIAVVYGNMFQYKKAIREWEEAKKIYKKIGLPENDALVDNILHRISVARDAMKTTATRESMMDEDEKKRQW